MEEEIRAEGWVFQREGGDRMGIQYLEEGFHEELRELQAREVGLIPDGVYVGDNMSLMRLLRRGFTTEFLNRYLETAVIDAKN